MALDAGSRISIRKSPSEASLLNGQTIPPFRYVTVRIVCYSLCCGTVTPSG